MKSNILNTFYTNHSDTDLANIYQSFITKRGHKKMKTQDNVLYFAKVRSTAIIPTKTEENAGYDIYANFDQDTLKIKPATTVTVPTGIASAISNGWYLQVEERGSTGANGIKKSAGVVDSSYRGEIFIAITNATDKTIIISKTAEKINITETTIEYPYKKAIAQLILHRVHNEIPVEEISYDELKEIPSVRKDGKLGASGK